MSTISISDTLSWETLNQLDPLLSVQSRQPLTIDLSSLSFCTPMGAASLASLITYLTFEKKCSIQLRRPTQPDVHQYLDRINFYYWFQIETGLSYLKHEASGKFVELAFLRNEQDCPDISTKVCNVLSQQMSIDENTRSSLDFVISEISENIFHHSQSQYGGFICCQSYPKNNEIHIAIVDLGRGIEASLKDNPNNLPQFSNRSPLEISIQPRATGRPDHNSGWGLCWTSDLASLNQGTLGILSINHKLVQKGDSPPDTNQQLLDWPGTLIHLVFRTNGELDISKAYAKHFQEEDDIDILF